jgi:hypothetical protein
MVSQPERRKAFAFLQHKAAFDVGDVIQTGDLLHDKVEISLRGFRGNVQDKVPAAGNVEAELYLGQLLHSLPEGVQQRGGLFFELDMRDDQHGLADLLAVKDGDIGFDKAGFLQPPDALGHRRFGEADLAHDLGDVHAGVALQELQDLQVDLVRVAVVHFVGTVYIYCPGFTCLTG